MGKKKKLSYSESLAKSMYELFDVTRKEKSFITLISILFLISGIFFPYPQIAMWIGFALAGYSAIANDSIQTIGTFIASNTEKKWWHLWLFIAGIFAVTVTLSWFWYDGDVSHQRLTSKGFDEAPTSFGFLQLAAPIFLLVLTRLRMPVSTTFLLLNVFSTDTSAIFSVIGKSMTGYAISFVLAMVVWLLVSRLEQKYFTDKPKFYWSIIQWVVSGSLWSVWIMQDAANIAIFLPRSLNVWQLIGFISYIVIGLGVLFYLKGDKIQKIVNEKTKVTDVRSASIIDLFYALILFYFKVISTTPISTTWVFIGLLGGRELAISLANAYSKRKKAKIRKSLRMLRRDFVYASIGLLISLVLAYAINPTIQEEVKKMLFGA